MPLYWVMRKDHDDKGREIYRFLTDAEDWLEAKMDLRITAREFDAVLVQISGQAANGQVKFLGDIKSIQNPVVLDLDDLRRILDETNRKE